ncbi:MAG: ComEA family DNA-binding protein [Lachnospiraceae bacterium]|nr:ComEA family DNA-binding protein [Lachnospiraceae bacterium]
MNRKYKIISGALCVCICLVLGAFKLFGNADEEVFTAEGPGDVTGTDPTDGSGDVTFFSSEATGSAGTEDDDSVMREAAEPAEETGDMSQNEPGGALEDPVIVVHVCGHVVSPGVYELGAGSRIYEAINAAGGLDDEADDSVINQADFCTDGMQINVPSAEEKDAEDQKPYLRAAEGNIAAADNTGHGQDAKSAASSDGKVNINTAGAEELMTLSGVGQSRAEAIIAYRNENGPFGSIEDIMNISGIKEGLFGKIRDKITVY